MTSWGKLCRARGLREEKQQQQQAQMAARQGLSQKKTQAGIPDMFWKLKHRLRIEQKEQAYGLRTQSILSCNLNDTELFLPLIITSLLQEESKHALLKTEFWLQDKTQEIWKTRAQDLVLPLQGERKGTQRQARKIPTSQSSVKERALQTDECLSVWSLH